MKFFSLSLLLQVDDFFKLISEFSMEYRTVHGKVLQKIERRKKEQARLKTKGKLIVSYSYIL